MRAVILSNLTGSFLPSLFKTYMVAAAGELWCLERALAGPCCCDMVGTQAVLLGRGRKVCLMGQHTARSKGETVVGEGAEKTRRRVGTGIRYSNPFENSKM